MNTTIVNNKKISIIVPCFNEEENIPHVVNEVDKCLKHYFFRYEFIFIDDGSTDGTYDAIMKLSDENRTITAIKLSRNFGKEAAVAAGLRVCDSDAAIVIDSDLQHPPDLIPSMIQEWERGAQIINAVKISRQKENIFNRLFALIFYRIMYSLTNMDFRGASDYKLLDRKAIDAINLLSEKNRFFRGLSYWVGFNHTRIEFKVEHRRHGESKWTFLKLVRLSVDAITSYTAKPLHIVTVLGGFTFLFSLILGIQTLYNKFYGHAVSGFTTVILALLMIASIIMVSIGILGLYVSKIYDEVKNRPLYIIEKTNKESKM